MKLLFGIMSAVQPAATVGSLADALGSRHPILVHHDWSQQPDFALARPNLAFVSRPERTGWAVWGFTAGILRLLEEALAGHRFDYFQLLSPTCLPVRPIDDFEAYLAQTGADYHISAVSLEDDVRARISHGYRAYADEHTLRFRLLRKTRGWMLGDAPPVQYREGLAFPTGDLLDHGGLTGLKARAAYRLLELARAGIGFDHPYRGGFRCHAGGTWFTASRRACEHLVTRFDAAGLARFSRQHMPDEMFFASVLHNSSLRGAPSTHYLSGFIDARPKWLTIADLEAAIASGRFFGRKFPEDPASDVRIELFRRLGLAATPSPRPPADAVAPAVPATPGAAAPAVVASR